MQIRRLCHHRVDLAEADESIARVARRMHQRNVGTVVVLDARRSPVGILTDRDLVTRVLSPGRDPGTTRVGEVMTERPATVHADTSLENALTRMSTAGVRRLPVVGDDGALVGILALDDVTTHFAQDMGLLADVLAAQRPDVVQIG